MAYKVGDRVVSDCIGNYRVYNAAGTVLYLKSASEILVEFDKNIGGHDGSHASPIRGKDPHCWFCKPREITLIKPAKIDIIVETTVEGKL